MSLQNLDDEIKKVLKRERGALSVPTISKLSGIPKKTVDMKIRKMRKNGSVKLHKTMRLRFYKLGED